MAYHNYYEILGVDKGASEADIQRAYRKLARQYHPDINKDASAESKFKQIGEAYEVLKNADKRAKYDQFGSAWKTAQQTGAPPPGWEGFDFAPGEGFDFGAGPSGFSSFFEMLFGGGGAKTWSPHQQSTPRRGADLESTIKVTLEELTAGGKRQITLQHRETGQHQRLEISLPAGARPGQRIRLSGKGSPGSMGAAPGDLLLKIELVPHPHFRVEGTNLLTTIDIPPWLAALGGEARVRTLEGDATIKLPGGSSSGRKIRLRGRGLGRAKDERGDLYGEVRIVVPESPTESERELYQGLASLSDEEEVSPTEGE